MNSIKLAAPALAPHKKIPFLREKKTVNFDKILFKGYAESSKKINKTKADKTLAFITSIEEQLSSLQSEQEKLSKVKKRLELIGKISSFLFSVACTLTGVLMPVFGPAALVVGGSVAGVFLITSVVLKVFEVKKQKQLDELEARITKLEQTLYLASVTALRKMAS